MTTELQPGTQLGSYRILSSLGVGGMGAVHVAEHQVIGRRVVIKVLHPEVAAEPQMVERLFNEARAANRVRHRGIVDIYDCGYTGDGRPYLVMELLEGESLARHAATRAGRLFPESEAAALVAEIADALGAAHRAGIVHRDLKPDNIFLSIDEKRGRQVKLLDFGIAQLAGIATARLTSTFQVFGTPYYMSPEQCASAKNVDHRADIYSLGVIAYELLCGRVPFLAEGVGRIMAMHQYEPPPSPRSLNLALSEAAAAVLLKALAKRPEERFATVEELASALSAGVPVDRRPAIVSACAPTQPVFPPTVVGVESRVPTTRYAPPTAPSLAAGELAPRPLRRQPIVLAGLVAGVAILGGGGLVLWTVQSGSGDGSVAPATQRTEVKRAVTSVGDQGRRQVGSASPEVSGSSPAVRPDATAIASDPPPVPAIPPSEPAPRWRVHKAPPRKAGISPQIIIGRSEVRGPLDRELVRSTVRQHINLLKYCYQQELAKDPAFYGRTVLAFTVSDAGAVASSRVEDSTWKNQAIDDCLVRAIQIMRFPAPSGGGIAIVRIPIVLRAAER